MTPGEEWRAVVGYEGCYEVSDQGRVRSLDRRVGSRWGATRLAKGRVLSAETSRAYRKVALKVDGTTRIERVHRLVAAAFLGPCPDGMEVCHINGDSLDNRLANLRYDTHVRNEADKRRHGTHNNSRKEHCPQGHPYDEINTLWWRTPTGLARKCKTCQRRSNREAARRRRAT